MREDVRNLDDDGGQSELALMAVAPSLHRWQVLALALGIDAVLGEVPLAVHPVAWMGRVIAFEQSYLPREGAARQLAAGSAVVAANVLLALTAGRCARWFALRLPIAIGLGAESLLLSTLLSQRMLAREALLTF